MGPDIDLASIRSEYETAGLDVGDVDPDPVTQFGRWFEDAWSAELDEPHAMILSTGDRHGPDGRVVLLRGFDADGFVFYTNHESAKGDQLSADARAAATFAWLGLHRQVRLRGSVEIVAADVSDAYFAGRPRGSQLGAWASAQSRVLADRRALEQAWADADRRFPDDVPRPPHWGGYRLVPSVVEFWQGRPSRLHDRIRYRRSADRWVIERLAP